MVHAAGRIRDRSKALRCVPPLRQIMASRTKGTGSMQRHLTAVAMAAAALFAAAATVAAELPTPVATGPAVGCVLIRNIQSTSVVDNKTIDFRMKGGGTFRNALPNACPQLGFERAFTYTTSQSQLCSVDLITVFLQGNPTLRGATCGIGKFTPIAPPASK
jgi:hypothetical protein